MFMGLLALLALRNLLPTTQADTPDVKSVSRCNTHARTTYIHAFLQIYNT
jgi:hypothetical protein